MKRHEDYAALLDAWIDGELTEEEAEAVRRHVADCPACSAYAADALAIREAFPSLEDTPVPEAFASSVLSALPPRDRIARWRKIALPLAACLALAVLARSFGGIGRMGMAGGGSGSAPESAAYSVYEEAAEAEEAPAEIAPFAMESAAAGMDAADADAGSGTTTAEAAEQGAALARTTGQAAASQRAGTEDFAEKTAPDSGAGDAEGRTFSASPSSALSGGAANGAIEADEYAAEEVEEAAEDRIEEDPPLSGAAVFLPPEAAPFLADFTPWQETEGGRWYVLTAEEYNGVLAAMEAAGLGGDTGRDAPPAGERVSVFIET